MTTPVFKGFTRQTIQFFKDIETNNNKEWFEANRKVYEKEVRDRLKELVLALTPAMSSIDPDFELRPHRTMSRINRDIRFSNNKDPYKTCMWISFQTPVLNDTWMNYPGFFLELNGNEYVYGVGFSQAKKNVMDDVRDHIRYKGSEFQEVTQRTVFDRGFVIGGEEYKRQIKSDLPAYFQPWIQRRSIYVYKTCPIGDEVFSSAFAEKIQTDFLELRWFYDFLKQSQP